MPPRLYRTKERREELMRNWPRLCARPSGYPAFFDWADAQHLHGLRQSKCPKCRQYYFPQEQAAHVCATLTATAP